MIRTISSLFLLAAAVCAQPRVTPIVFDESASDRIRISAPGYELTLAKSNGAILGVRDRAAGVEVTSGSRSGCLWGVTIQTTPATNRGGCSSANFRYLWDVSRRLLTLVYRDPAFDVTVTLSAAEEFFDLQLELKNHTGAVLDSVALPSDLTFETAAIRAAYLPYFLPGVRLEPSFFGAHKSFTATYPGARAFADHLALEAGGGRIAWYVVNPGGRIAPVTLGFRESASQPGRSYALHNYQIWIREGATYSSPVVRVRVGQTVERTILAYRAENGIDRYPSIASKLGDRFQTVAQAPMVKMDFHNMRRTFAEASARLREIIEAPALLHPVAYWERSFDQNYPDFLPPNEQFGSTKDFRDFVAEAHRLGLFVMPYTNPTWWADSEIGQRLECFRRAGERRQADLRNLRAESWICGVAIRSGDAAAASAVNGELEGRGADGLRIPGSGGRAILAARFSAGRGQSAGLFRAMAQVHGEVCAFEADDGRRMGSLG